MNIYYIRATEFQLMRGLFTIVFILLFLQVQAGFVNFSAVVEDAAGKEFRLYRLINELTAEEVKYTGIIKENDELHIAIEIAYPQIVRFELDTSAIEIFVRPIDRKVSFKYNIHDLDGTLYFTGDREADNNFLKVYHKNFLNHSAEKEIYSKGFLNTEFDKELALRAKSYGIQDYFDYIDREVKYQQEYLNRQAKISPELRSYLRKELYWDYESRKFAYFIFNQERFPANQLSSYWLKYRLLQTVDINDDYALVYPVFQNLLSAFIHYLNLENPVDVSTGDDIHYYRFVERNLDAKSKSFMQAKLMLNAFRMGEPQMAQRKFKEFKRFNQYAAYTQSLEDWFGNQMQYLKKKTVPNFTFLHEDGREASLDQLRGKVVYVSLWASWCGPCIEGFKKTYDTRKRLAQQGVIMLNVDLDRTEAKWRQTLTAIDIPGTNVYGLDLADFQEKLKFDTLPFYILVDKFGFQTYLSARNLNAAIGDFTALMSASN
jgi:thiol-disulfide isomerase/thioredoxin